jgi:alkylated DNA nucleotide flippase Atl1
VSCLLPCSKSSSHHVSPSSSLSSPYSTSSSWSTILTRSLPFPPLCSVGSALRNNPFAPTIPCHRVLDSKLYIGGFGGEWPSGNKGGEAFKPGPKVKEKLELLRREGVEFDGKGYLRDKRCLWDGEVE